MRKKPFLTKKAAVKFSFAHNPRHIGFFPKPMCGMQACFLRIAKPQHLRWEALGFGLPGQTPKPTVNRSLR